MKVYRVMWIDPHEGTCYEWAETMDAAEKIRAAVFEAHKDVSTVGIHVIEVPTEKAKLVKWLNHWLNRDNG